MADPNDQLGPLDDDIASYVDAYLSLERPSSHAARQTWTAIGDATTPTPRGPWVAVALLAAAACLLLLWVNRDFLTPTRSNLRDAQAPYQALPAEPEATAEGGAHGSVRVPRAAKGAAPIEVVEPQPVAVPEPAPNAEAPSPPPGDRPARTGTTRRKPPAPKAADPPSLARETELLKAMQESLVAGRSAEALADARAYAKEFPRGVFRHEVTIATARALCSLGRSADARATASAFVSKHPRSHLVQRARKICAD